MDWLSICLWSLTVLLTAVGFAGTILPLPGPLFVLGGSICMAFALGEPYPAWWVWCLVGLLCAGSFVIDNICTYFGARQFGSSKAAMWGSIIGVFAGAFFFPIGLILGPFAGAFIAEFFVVKRGTQESLKSGTGALLGYFAGVLGKMLLCAAMLGLVYLA